MNESEQDWRRWTRYSLRSFIVVVVITSIVVALIANRHVDRKATIEAIHAAGGTMGTKLAGPKWLRRLFADENYFRQPIRISLGGITDRAPTNDAKEVGELLVAMSQFSTLTALDLRKSTVQDADLLRLRNLTKLEVLRLSNTQITDDGLKHLAGMTSLKSIWLSNTNVTEEGIRELQASLGKCEIRH